MSEPDEVQAASSSRPKKDWKTPSNHSTKRRKTFIMRTRSNAEKAFSDGRPFLDLKNGLD